MPKDKSATPVPNKEQSPNAVQEAAPAPGSVVVQTIGQAGTKTFTVLVR